MTAPKKKKKAEKHSEHKCFSHCPNCNAGVDDIDWGDYEGDSNELWQEAICKKCGCFFHEVYKYSFTFVKEEGTKQNG